MTCTIIDILQILSKFSIAVVSELSVVDSVSITPDSWVTEIVCDQLRFVVFGGDNSIEVEHVQAEVHEGLKVIHGSSDDLQLKFCRAADATTDEMRPEMLYSIVHDNELVFLLRVSGSVEHRGRPGDDSAVVHSSP